MHGTQRRRRVDTQFLDEALPHPAVGLERVGLSAAAGHKVAVVHEDSVHTRRVHGSQACEPAPQSPELAWRAAARFQLTEDLAGRDNSHVLDWSADWIPSLCADREKPRGEDSTKRQQLL